MKAASQTPAPMRITDIVAAKSGGAAVVVHTRFEILPVDFHHSDSPYQAYVFLVHCHGTIDGEPFEFRKCYARGCPSNLCTHVSLAVRIANRYLQRDYQALKSAGITLAEHLFTLDAMVVKFEQLTQGDPAPLTLPELANLARAGSKVEVDQRLAYLPAVEHFANQKNARTFLSGEFTARVGEKAYICHRCFACYAMDRSASEKSLAVKVANARLEMVYRDFQQAGIHHQRQFFH